MEVYFVDVGRGTSCVVLLGEGRAIVIDCGQNADVLLQLLHRYEVHTLTGLCVSHNHDDHVGGAVAVMTDYEGLIERIWFLDDGVLRQTAFWSKVQQQLESGALAAERIFRLERANQPAMLYQERKRPVTLKIFSPRFLDNLQAIQSGAPNATSAVLVLDCGGRRMVFAGDSKIRQWRRIRQERNGPLTCDVLSVAHHAGIVWDNPTDLEWLFSEGVLPGHAVVSVATSNTDKHPRPEVIRRIVTSGGAVLCTQITKQCCDDLESLRPGVLSPQLPGRSQPGCDLTKAGNSRNVACAGTVVVEVTGGQLVIHRRREHLAAVDRLAARSDGHPLCRS